jgi:hypothetical protein
VSDDDLRSLLLQFTPSAREYLRNVLIRDFHDRNEMSSILLRYRDGLATTGPTSSTC